MKNIVNYVIDAMELNNYNFKVKENGWDDTITVVLIDNEGEETFIIDFNIELEKIYIFEAYNNVELIHNYDLHNFMLVTGFIESFYIC